MSEDLQSVNIEAKASSKEFRTSRLAGLVEIAVVLGLGLGVVLIATAIFGKNPIASIAAVWAANTLMLTLIYFGLRARGQGWSDFGLDTRLTSWRSIPRVFAQSIPVFVAATGAFVLGAILMANIVGLPDRPDMDTVRLRGVMLRSLLSCGAAAACSLG